FRIGVAGRARPRVDVANLSDRHEGGVYVLPAADPTKGDGCGQRPGPGHLRRFVLQGAEVRWSQEACRGGCRYAGWPPDGGKEGRATHVPRGDRPAAVAGTGGVARGGLAGAAPLRAASPPAGVDRV